MLDVTEDIYPEGKDIDLKSPREILQILFEADRTVDEAIARALPEIEKAATEFADTYRRGGRVMYVGSGTSGRLAVADAAELEPTFSVEPGRVFAMIAGGYEALVHPQEGAEDDAEAGAALLDLLSLTPADLVLGITSSGRTPFVVACLQEAFGRHIGTVGIFNNPEAPIRQFCRIPVFLDTGPEVIAGSTRMKAGVAQKRVLHMISTTAMILCGKVFSHWMVEVKAGSEKLRRRARLILKHFSSRSEAELSSLLEQVHYEVKTAILMEQKGISAGEARQRLRLCGGSLRHALRI